MFTGPTLRYSSRLRALVSTAGRGETAGAARQRPWISEYGCEARSTEAEGGSDGPDAGREMSDVAPQPYAPQPKWSRCAGAVGYCGRRNSPTYTALPRTCPCIARITAARVSNAAGTSCALVEAVTSSKVSNAYNSKV
jgi:hypothetical protein